MPLHEGEEGRRQSQLGRAAWQTGGGRGGQGQGEGGEPGTHLLNIVTMVRADLDGGLQVRGWQMKREETGVENLSTCFG